MLLCHRSTIAESDDEESAESTTDEDEESFSGAIEKEKQMLAVFICCFYSIYDVLFYS